jgi:N4-gp56 family major capsid protein
MPDVLFDTAVTNFDKTVVALVQKRLEEELRSKLVHMSDAVKGSYVAGTNLLRYVAYRDLDITTGTPSPGTPPWLTEGVPPDAEDLSISYDEIAAYQAGRVVGLTDVALTQSPHDLIDVAADRVAFNAAATIDKYIADIIKAGTAGTIFSGSGNTQTSEVAAGDVLAGSDIKRAVASLAARSVNRFGDGYYHAIIHPAAVLDVETDTDAGGWIDANKYTDNRPLLAGELGRYAGVRFMESAYAGIFADAGTGSIDVYSTVIYGPGAWVFGDMQTLRTYFVRGQDKADPLDQVAKIGWKAMFGAGLLDSNGARYVRIESATSL